MGGVTSWWPPIPPSLFAVCAPAQQPAPQPPLVALVEPQCDDGGGDDDDDELELLCIFWSSEVEKVKATWLLNGQEMHLPTAKKVEHGRSGLKVKRDSWDKGDVYTCQVTQPLGGAVVMRNTSKCLGKGGVGWGGVDG